MLVAEAHASEQVLGGERVPSSGYQVGAAPGQRALAKDKTVFLPALPPGLFNAPLGLVCFSPYVKKINKD